jgi:hypothetical protein
MLKDEELDYLYAIRETGKDGFIKIGISDQPLERLRGVQTGNPRKLELIGVCPVLDAGKVESSAHETLQDYRQEGEWFSPAPAVRRFIEWNVLQPFKPQHLRLSFEEYYTRLYRYRPGQWEIPGTKAECVTADTKM